MVYMKTIFGSFQLNDSQMTSMEKHVLQGILALSMYVYVYITSPMFSLSLPSLNRRGGFVLG